MASLRDRGGRNGGVGRLPSLPFGMADARLLTPADLAQIESFELRARTVVEGFITGLHKSPFHGFSVEFAEHRAYNPGDPLRHVDWKVYGRSDRLVTKRYEEETNLRHYVVLDTSASMRYAGHAGVSKLAYGATLAGALHVLMARQRDATGLMAFDRTVHTSVPPKSTRGHVQTLLARLSRWADGPEPGDGAETNATAALHEIAERIPRRSLVVVISDLFDTSEGDGAATLGDHAETVRALQHLRHRGHEVVVFHVLDDATERRFAFPDRPVRVRDLETGQERTLQPAQIREGYQAAADAFVEGLRRACRQAGVDYQPLDTAPPLRGGAARLPRQATAAVLRLRTSHGDAHGNADATPWRLYGRFIRSARAVVSVLRSFPDPYPLPECDSAPPPSSCRWPSSAARPRPRWRPTPRPMPCRCLPGPA